jgi:hypothetical protein
LAPAVATSQIGQVRLRKQNTGIHGTLPIPHQRAEWGYSALSNESLSDNLRPYRTLKMLDAGFLGRYRACGGASLPPLSLSPEARLTGVCKCRCLRLQPDIHCHSGVPIHRDEESGEGPLDKLESTPHNEILRRPAAAWLLKNDRAADSF